MPRRYCSHLIITDHAHGRWRLRAPGQYEPSATQIMRRLNGMLRGGVVPNESFCIDVPMIEKMVAVCSPMSGEAGCGWAVVTWEYSGQWQKFNREEVAK